MQRSLPILLAMATLSAAAYAQYPIQQPAYPAGQARRSQPMQPAVTSTQPIQGVWLRTDSTNVKTVSADANGTEIRVDHGRANVEVYRAPANAQILVDLPGGQISVIKDGLYTFNAETNTVSVLRGEADAYPGGNTNAKPIKVKEDHQLAFAGNDKPAEVDPRRIAADVLPIGPGQRGMGEGYAPRGYGYGYGEGPYGDGPYGYAPVYPYPYYGYGYPYYGYPFGFGVGFGYYGGFYGGGFRGGGYRR